MLSRARTSGLCHGCRQELQVLFERGFCGPTVTSKTRNAPLRWRRVFEPRQQLRSFTNTRASLQQQPPPGSEKPQKYDEEDPNSQPDPVPDHLEVLKELEKALGRPIEEAIDEDRARGERQIDALLKEQSLGTDIPSPIPDTRDPLSSLRSLGASSEEVVREARQIYGDGLPSNALNENEFKLYRRLYGDPISTSYEEFLDEEEASEVVEDGRNQLLDQEGELVHHEHSQGTYAATADLSEEEADGISPPKPAQRGIGLDTIGEMRPSPLTSPAERTTEIARLLGAEVIEDTDQDDAEDDEDPGMRQHPFTRLGKFATSPSSIQLPQEDFVLPVHKIMTNFSNKHLKDMCEKTFGGPGLPDSPLTPRSGRSRPQVPIPLDASQHMMGEMEANAFITTIMPPTFSAIMSVLVETRKRLGTTWLNNLIAKEGGPRILDAGAGGAGILAWREVVKAHWESLHSSDRNSPPPPPAKSVVLTGSDTLRHRAATLLENTTFIPRLPDYVHTRDMPTLEDDRPAQQRKQFDLIIAPHSLFGLQEDWMRKQHVQNLWSMLSPEGGVLILIEKGIPRGFEAIAGARELLLERYIGVPEGETTSYSASRDPEVIHTRETGMIVAPCTNHEKCPMYRIPGVSQGRKDFCSFQQRYIRPNYLQRILGAKDRNHDDVDFSYISVMRGEDLRQRQVDSWRGLEDGLSAPLHPDPQIAAEDHKTWTQVNHEGFDGVTPDATLEDFASVFAEGQTPSTLPVTWNLPRLVFTPMKRRGHIILDVCTPTGKIERWTVPKSFGKQAYRDARKSQWGDLWALGAKTRIPRNLRLGGADTKEARKARSRSQRLKDQAADLLEKMEEEKLEEMEEGRELERMFSGDGLDDDELGVPAKRSQRPTLGKVQREPSTDSSVDTFTFDDFDLDEINPPLPRKKDTSREVSTITPSTSQSTPPRAPRKRPNLTVEEADDYEDDVDLTAEEIQNLRDWEAELSSGDRDVKTKGGRPLRRYSKFAGPGEKRGLRKSGKATAGWSR